MLIQIIGCIVTLKEATGCKALYNRGDESVALELKESVGGLEENEAVRK